MTAPSHAAPRGALEAVQRLESALEEQHAASDVAAAALDAARAEAERLLAAGRDAGADAGRRRRDALLAEAEADAAAIRAAGETEARDVLERVAAGRDDLVAALTAQLFPREP
jgi:hypothetical protein